MSRFLGALLVLGVLAQVAWAQLQPPFHKTWETKVTAQLQSVVLDNGTLYYGTSNAYGALEQVTGKRLWEVVLPEKYFGASVALYKGTLYVAVGMQGLQGCDPKTGKTLWSVPSSYYSIPPSRLQDRVFATPREGFLSAIHTSTHRTLWTRDLRRAHAPQGNASMHGPSVVVPLNAKSLLVGTYDAEVLCLDVFTGKPRWRTAFPLPTYRGEVSGITVGSRIYVSHDGTLEALSPQTGRVLWRFTREDNFSAALELPDGRLVVMTRAGMLYIVGAVDGKLRRSVRVAKDGHTGIAPPRLLGSQLLVGADEKLQAFDLHGKQLWEWPLASPGDNFINTELPTLFPEPGGIVVVGFHELVHFSLGAPTGAAHDPAERRAQAQALVPHLDNLSHEEKRLLIELGDDAFAVLLPVVQERVAHYRSDTRLDKALDVLGLVMQPRHTQALLDIWKQASNHEAQGYLLAFLAGDPTPWMRPLPPNRVDPEWVIPVFMAELAKGRQGKGWIGTARNYLSRSSHPTALSLMKTKLADPTAEPELRRAAYLNLARTGGAAFVPAILAARDTRRTVPSLATRLELKTLAPTILPEEKRRYETTYVLALEKDRHKQLWALLVSGVLGSARDLWIARWDGTQWREPLFTGKRLTLKEIKGEESEVFPTDWQKRFVGNPALRRDSDHDGLTDLVEARLGTNPHRADSDGDGLRDGVDKNPLATPHPLTEQEKILAAAFEGRYHLDDSSSPCQVELPPGIRPLELAGRQEVIVCTADGKHNPLERVMGEGATFVSFGLPNYDFQQTRLLPTTSKQWLLWNADHTEVRLSVNAYIGKRNATGYDIQLKKFGDNWIVVKAEMTWIS